MANRRKKPVEGETPMDEVKKMPEAPKENSTEFKEPAPGEQLSLPIPTAPRSMSAKRQETPLPAIVEGPGAIRPSSGAPVSFLDEEKHNFFTRILFLLLLAVVVAASVLIFALRPSAYTEQTDSVKLLYCPEQNVTQVAVNGVLRGEIAGSVTYTATDGTGRVCVAIADGRLYTVKGRDVTWVCDGVTDCALAANGQYLAWRTEARELFYQAVGKEESRYRISGSCTDDRYSLSPSGKELLYTYTGEDGILRLDVYSGSGSKPYLSQNEELYPVAVADRCRYVYYTDQSGALYVLSTKENVRRKCGDSPDLGSLIFNRAYSEVLFYDGGQTRIFRKGENVILPDIASTDLLTLIPNRRVSILSNRVGTHYLMETFFENYYVYSADSTLKLVLLERKKEQGRMTDVSFVDSADSVTVTDKSVFFLRTASGAATHTNLYRCKTGKTEVLDLEWDVQDFCTNVDGSRLLYVDVHGALYSLQIGAVPVILYDHIEVQAGITVTADDAFYFYRAPGKLCVSDNGAAPRELREGVLSVAADAHTAFYTADVTENGTFTVYANHRSRRKDVLLAGGVGRVD